METETEAKISFVDGKIVMKEEKTTVMEPEQAMKNQVTLNQMIMQHKQNVTALKKAIEEKEIEERLATAEKEVAHFQKAFDDTQEALKPYINDIKQKAKGIIKQSKAKDRYSGMNDERKVVYINEVLGKFADDHGLDMGFDIIKELKAEFDKI